MTQADPYVVRVGSGRPILMIHGNPVDHRALLPLEDAFERVPGWRRIYVDLPGFGGSEPLPHPGGAQELADWMRTFVQAEFGGTQFAVVGNSFGGLLARNLVADLTDQVVGLALLCTVVDSVHEQRNCPPKSVLRRDRKLLARLTSSDQDEYESMAVVQSDENWQRFESAVLPGLRSHDHEAVERLSSSYTLADVPECRSDPFYGPSLIVTGRQDHVVGFEDQARLLPHYRRATYTVLDRAGHNAHLDQPEIVNTLINEWLMRMNAETP